MKETANISVPSPLHTAGNSLPDYYSPECTAEAQAAVVGVPLTRFLLAGARERAVMYIVSLWAMRVGEYLRVTVSDLLGNDMVFVRGEKGSADYRINLPGIDTQFVNGASLCPGRLVSGTSYIRVYRACVRCGVGAKEKANKNLARTHKARYDLAAKTFTLGSRAAGDLLHHRSPKTVSSYVGA